MANKLFGTDGIRAEAGRYPLDFSSISTLGNALVALLRAKGLAPRVLIGRDTRESGAWMERALVQGLVEAGGEPASAGVIPTSAVSYLLRENDFSAGAVISASHNPFRDNGIKVFSHEGVKIPEDWEAELEAAILGSREEQNPVGAAVAPDPRLAEDYVAYLEGRYRAGRPAGGFQGRPRLRQRRQLGLRAARLPRPRLRRRPHP